jgi:YfiR/HmsC-like
VDLRRALIAALGLAACFVTASELPASEIQERVKAAFLSKFPAYVEWPASAFPQPASPLVIGVAGAEAVARELDQAVAGRTVAGRPLRVRRIAAGEPPDDCCQVLFVGAAYGHDRTADLLAQVRGRPVLTVTDLEDQPQGSVINFLVDDHRVRFDISRPAAERNGLHVRAQLLAVARQATEQ